MAKRNLYLNNTPIEEAKAQYLAAVKAEMLVVRELFAFLQRERCEGNLPGHAIVKSAPRPEDFVHDPGRGGTADDEEDVLASRSPCVPEQLKRLEES